MERTEAIEVIRKCWPVNRNGMLSDALETLIPELRESEDERIRKTLIHIVKGACDKYGIKYRGEEISEEKLLDYLEKQKENPKTVDSIPPFCVSNVKWVDTIITRAIVALSDDVDYNRDEPCKYRREIDDLKKLRDVLCGQKEQQPAEWSEEDEKAAYFINQFLEYHEASDPTAKSCKEWFNNRLKSLRPPFKDREMKLKILKYLSTRCSSLEFEEVEEYLNNLRPQPRGEIYQTVKHDLAIKFMNYLDENRPEGKMNLSNGECEDIDKAFQENDWAKILRYIEKYGK